MSDTIKVMNREKIPIISAIISLIISFFIIDFSSIQEFDVWLFVAIIFVYSMTFMFFYISITSFVDNCEADLREKEDNWSRNGKRMLP